MRERSRAKSSAAKIRPERYGVLVQMEGREVSALADSIRARIFKGGFWKSLSGFGDEGCRAGRMCWITSVTKWRSAALLTFGITKASRWGAFRTSCKSASARPLDTSFIRTLISEMCSGRLGWERKLVRDCRASDFLVGVTESSRS